MCLLPFGLEAGFELVEAAEEGLDEVFGFFGAAGVVGGVDGVLEAEGVGLDDFLGGVIFDTQAAGRVAQSNQKYQRAA